MTTLIASASYGPANEMLSLTGGAPYWFGGYGGESRVYNSLKQLTSLSSGTYIAPLSITYNYPSTGNNGKIGSQYDSVSGETVTYAYDALNRLASATSSTSSWGQAFTYDGFGNLTGTSVTAGSAPTLAETYDVNNHAGGEDANGNPGGVLLPAYSVTATPAYDVENRLTSLYSGTLNPVPHYSYAPDNKRVWYGQLNTSGTLSIDEITFWSVTGQKLAVYDLTTISGLSSMPQFYATQNNYNLYFGGKLIQNANGWVYSDRLNSIGKFYPYGIERPSATTNGTEKFTGYFRDAESGNDYAVNRYMSPGMGRFITPDTISGNPADPGSWNKYAYVGGDPINRTDPSGQDWCSIDATSYDNCDGVGPDQNGVCYILTAVGGDYELLGYPGCNVWEWGDPGTLNGGGGGSPCGGVLALAGSGCLSGGSGVVGQPVSYILLCSTEIAPAAYQYMQAILYILNDNSWGYVGYMSKTTPGGAASSLITPSTVQQEDYSLASILFNRANDPTSFGVGGSTVNSQACSAPGGGPNSADKNGNVGCGRLLNGMFWWNLGINAYAGTSACQDILEAVGAILSVISSGPTSTATYNWGLSGGQPTSKYLNQGGGLVYLGQQNNTLLYTLP